MHTYICNDVVAVQIIVNIFALQKKIKCSIIMTVLKLQIDFYLYKLFVEKRIFYPLL